MFLKLNYLNMILGYYGTNRQLGKNGIAFQSIKFNAPWDARRTHNKILIGDIIEHNLSVLKDILI